MPITPDPDDQPALTLTDMLQAMRSLIMSADRFRALAADRLGIGTNEILILSLIGAPSPVTPSELGELLGRKAPTITAALDRLEDAGMIIRQPHPSDRRKIVVTPTQKGHTSLSWIRSFSEDAFTHLEARELADLTHTFKDIAATIDRQAVRIHD